MADNININPSGSTPIATDDVNGVHYQKVKMVMGDTGQDGGEVSQNNPLTIEIVGYLRRLFQVFGRFSFGTSSALRTEIANTPAVTVSSGTVTTVTTVSTVTQSNVSLGDTGKTSTAMLMSQMAFVNGVGRNFIRT